MLRNTRTFEKCTVHALDGDVGKVRDVYFDDERWVVRYLVVESGGWLTGREVLLSPLAVTRIDWDRHRVDVNLTRQKIGDSPGIETHQPVSRQNEAALFRHYGYPYYWGGPYAWGYAVLPVLAEQQIFDDAQRLEIRKEMEDTNKADRHLRSCNDIAGYKIAATDAKLGHVVDFLFDEEDWSIQYLVVDPRDLWPGKHVLVAAEHIEHVYWGDKEVVVNIGSKEIERAPAYDPGNPPPAPRRQPPPAHGTQAGAAKRP